VSVRLFVAVDLDEPARDFVAEAVALLQDAGVDERFIAREKWHATLAFLGLVDGPRHSAVETAVASAAAQCAPFELVLDTVGAFPNADRPLVVWVGSSVPQAGFTACAEAVRGSLAPLEIRFDHEAVPHVTVCRIKRRAAALPAIALNRSVSVRVDSLALYESVSVGPTTAYKVISRAVLGEDRKGRYA